MTHTELALELAELECVKTVFDRMVTEIIAANRATSMQKMLETPGRPPAAVMEQAQKLDRALEKVDHNMRRQYEEFLSSYVSVREKLFTPDQIQKFVATLREPAVRYYLDAMRDAQKELFESTAQAAKKMIERAMKISGTQPAPGATVKAV